MPPFGVSMVATFKEQRTMLFFISCYSVTNVEVTDMKIAFKKIVFVDFIPPFIVAANDIWYEVSLNKFKNSVIYTNNVFIVNCSR